MAKKATLAQVGAFWTMIHTLFLGLFTEKNDDLLSKIDGSKIQDAIDIPGKNNFLFEFIKWINNGCKLNYLLINAFVLGDIFKHRAEEGNRRLYFDSSYNTACIQPYLKKLIPIRNDFGKISEYNLPKNMKDSEIQKATGNPGCMSFDDYCCLKYLLIFQPESAKQIFGFELSKSKWYVLHVILPNGEKVAVCVYWDDDEWDFGSCAFGVHTWLVHRAFLFFSTAKK